MYLKATKSFGEEKAETEKSNKPILIVLCCIFLIYSATLIFPFVWMLFNSVKDKVDFQFRQWEVTAAYLQNYTSIFKEFNLLEMFGNSLILCIGIPVLSVFSTCCMAYAVACFKFKFRTFLYYLAVSVMFIPVAGSLATTYKLMTDTGLMNTYIGVILLSSSGFGFNFMLLHSTYKTISPTYSEAAMIDGAGYWRTFLTIVSPQASPTIVALLVLSFVGVWNNYETQYLFLPGHKTISTGIYEISNSAEMSGDYPKLFAIILVTVIPVITLFLIFQKKIMEISMGGGIKE